MSDQQNQRGIQDWVQTTAGHQGHWNQELKSTVERAEDWNWEL